jgi:hypothetical protein
MKYFQAIALKVSGVEGEIIHLKIVRKYWGTIHVIVREVDLAGLLIRSRVNLVINRVFISLLLGGEYCLYLC